MNTVRLKDIVEIQLGKMLSPKSKTGKRPMPYLRNANVQWDRFDLGEVYEMDFDPREEKKFLLRPGDILVCEGGEPGRAAVWTGALDPCLYQKALHRLRPIGGVVDPQFLVYRLWLGSDRGELIGDQAKTTIAHLPKVRLANLEVQIPSIAEQRRIVARLTDQLAAVNAARSSVSKRLATLRSLRGRAYRVALSYGTTFSILPNDFRPSGWSWHKLTDLARLESGHTPSRRRPEWWAGEIPWIALPDIRQLDGKVALDTSEMTNPEGIAHSAARVLPRGTVVMSRTASVGFVTRMGRPMATSQDFVNWVCGPDLDPEFLMHLLIRSRDEVRALSSGAIHKTVYMPTVKAFRVCVPPIGEQRRIAAELRERLAVIDAIEASVRTEREAIEALPAALLRRAFDGLAA
jgi:Restriction endonuclease S subunits